MQAQGPELNTAHNTTEKDAKKRLYYIVLSKTFFGFIQG
jgi:hypothetical protein